MWVNIFLGSAVSLLTVTLARHSISRAPAALARPVPAPPPSPAPPHEAPGWPQPPN
ncbi:hypothetical protein ACIA98_30560 [Streptomyces sp. NPDC051366]|uniref:hypothetical protein n=1 Tax=Streptomyces sp. NPDC051366 TaxID=3365652 RepID=UPI0037B40947